MQVNAEAIHATRAVAPYKEGKVALTRKGNLVYAIYLSNEGESSLPAEIRLGSLRPRAGSSVTLLGSRAHIPWRTDGNGAVFEIPEKARKTAPCKYACVLKFTLQGRNGE